MIFLSTLALVCGMIGSLNLIINAKLASHRGALRASYWNHLTGFVCMLIPVSLIYSFQWANTVLSTPPILYVGALLGVSMVALFSWVITRIGATRAMLFMICGKMLASTLIDGSLGRISNIFMQVLGIALICLGVWISQRTLQKETLVHSIAKPEPLPYSSVGMLARTQDLKAKLDNRSQSPSRYDLD